MDSENTQVKFTTDQELVSSIIEDALPKENNNRDLGNPQSDGNRLGSRIMYLWVWPIIAINTIRNLVVKCELNGSVRHPKVRSRDVPLEERPGPLLLVNGLDGVDRGGRAGRRSKLEADLHKVKGGRQRANRQAAYAARQGVHVRGNLSPTSPLLPTPSRALAAPSLPHPYSSQNKK